MTTEKKMTLTASRIILIRELSTGAKRFTQLRTAYFGEGRAKANKATTAFYNKISKGLEEGLIVKQSTGVYELGPIGREMLEQIKEQGIDMASVKSEAEIRWAAANVKA